MNYNEFTDYLAGRILAVRHRELVPGTLRRSRRYYDAVYESVMECRAYFDRFSLDEGPHNDYDPTSRASVEAYRVEMYGQMAKELGEKAAYICTRGDTAFMDSVLMYPLRYGEEVSDERFARAAAQHMSNIVFERTCSGCGATYKVAVKAQTYRMVSNHHPATCAAMRAVPVQVAKPVQPAPGKAVRDSYEVTPEHMQYLLKRFGNVKDNKPIQKPSGPVIPDEILRPRQKPAPNSPAYRANVEATLRLYADFLKFYEESPLPDSDPEENQRQMKRIYNVVVNTVFHFDPAANKNK